jgi:hypothetical protein
MASKGRRVHNILKVRAHSHDGLLTAIVRDVFDRPLLKLELPIELRLGVSEVFLEVDAELVQEIAGKDSKEHGNPVRVTEIRMSLKPEFVPGHLVWRTLDRK